ncbi:MAG: hypothetical protein KBG28_13065 [Kofleriaceae bacterium]|nr:hypothetical protein [Kofleriaceae bacterium]
MSAPTRATAIGARVAWLAVGVLAALGAPACRGASAERSAPRTSSAEPTATATAPAPVGAGAATADMPALPPGWARLDRVAAAGTAEAGQGASVTVQAWGDRAAGCYAMLVSSAGTTRASIAAVVAGLREVVASELGAADLPDPTAGAGAYDATVALTGGAMTGQLRVRAARASDGTPRLVALACVGNEREPAACQQACGPILATAPAPGTPSTPGPTPTPAPTPAPVPR